MVNFSQRLKGIRKSAGMTQQQLANKLGVTKSVVSYYELQERSPSPEILIKLAYIFNVSTDYLLGLETTRTLDVSDLRDEEVQALLQLIHLFKSNRS